MNRIVNATTLLIGSNAGKGSFTNFKTHNEAVRRNNSDNTIKISIFELAEFYRAYPEVKALVDEQAAARMDNAEDHVVRERDHAASMPAPPKFPACNKYPADWDTMSVSSDASSGFRAGLF